MTEGSSLFWPLFKFRGRGDLRRIFPFKTQCGFVYHHTFSIGLHSKYIILWEIKRKKTFKLLLCTRYAILMLLWLCPIIMIPPTSFKGVQIYYNFHIGCYQNKVTAFVEQKGWANGSIPTFYKYSNCNNYNFSMYQENKTYNPAHKRKIGSFEGISHTFLSIMNIVNRHYCWC